MELKKRASLVGVANTARIDALEMVYRAQSGHIASSFSVMDILVYLYEEVMKVDAKQPHWADRDRLVVSKGHCTPALYAVLAQKGFIPKDDLKGFRQIDSYLSGHAEINVPGVDMSTGSLGHGLSVACGMALAAKIDQSDYTVYSIHGDGELQEGMIWEAAMSASKYKLDNLVAIIDDNKLQLDGTVEEIMPSLYPIKEKFEAFGWQAIVCSGHDFAELAKAFAEAKAFQGQPVVIIAQTIKGKGVSFMENEVAWHGLVPSEKAYKEGLAQLSKTLGSEV